MLFQSQTCSSFEPASLWGGHFAKGLGSTDGSGERFGGLLSNFAAARLMGLRWLGARAKRVDAYVWNLEGSGWDDTMSIGLWMHPVPCCLWCLCCCFSVWSSSVCFRLVCFGSSGLLRMQKESNTFGFVTLPSGDIQWFHYAVLP